MFDVEEIQIRLSTKKYNELRKRIATKKGLPLICIDIFDVQNFIYHLVMDLLQGRMDEYAKDN